jgi:hypothetical protein
VRGITEWQSTSSPGREVAVVPEPVPFSRLLTQYAVRTPSKDHASGYYQAVLFTTRVELEMLAVVDHYDGRAGIEAELKSDKRGLGLAVIRKRRLAAQMLVVLLVQLAHNVLSLCTAVAGRTGSAPGQVWDCTVGRGKCGQSQGG